MDPLRNPYAPGAGKQPPELTGRDDVIERAAIALQRIRSGRAARSIILYGLRGVGKTVLLNKIRRDAEAHQITAVPLEAPEGRSLPGVLAPNLRTALIALSRGEAFKDGLARAMRALAGFVRAFKVKYQDIEVSIEVEPERGLADTGDLDADLVQLFLAVGKAAHEHHTALVLFIDELQYVPNVQLAALISALHRTSQDELPVTMLAAGLPQLLGKMGDAKSYAERLFEFVEIDRLPDAPAKDALCKPAESEGASFTDDAIAEILRQTQGYPYFLQEWGKHSWVTAKQSPITLADVKIASATALAEMDASFFRVRFDRLTLNEKKYLRAMAELGSGTHRSGDVAERLGKKVTAVSVTRNSLIGKGMIYSLSHGDNAFTVPLFEGFMKRIMPEFQP